MTAKIRHIIGSAALVAALLCIPAQASEIDATGLYDLPPSDIVILGETHDNPTHHAHQAIAIEAVAPRAVVFEMLTDEQAQRVTPKLTQSEEALGAILGWEGSGWPDFAMYYPVFVAARDARVFGGTETRGAARRAMREGAAAVFGETAPRFGLDRKPSAADQLLREADQLSAHCDAIPEDLLPGMVEAQRLRDAWLARAAVQAHAETGGPVVVITGNGHARKDWGVPAVLAEAAPDLTVLAIGQLESEADRAPPYDLWLVTDPVPRPDPCAAFR